MRKLFPLLLLLLAAAAAWFVFAGDDPEVPGAGSQEPDAPPPVVAAGDLGPGAPPAPAEPEVGRTEVTGAGNDAAANAVARAGEIRGQVLTPGGQPLAGASVLLLRRGEESAFLLGQDHAAVVDARLTTDRDGWYRVKGLAAGTAWNVWAWHEEYAFAEGGAVEGFVGSDQELPPIRMSQGFVLEVRVVDLSDRGVEGARVELTLDGMPPASSDEPDPLGRRFVVTSEADGFAGFESLGPGSWVLRASKPGHGDGWLRPLLLLPGREPPPVRLLLGPEFGLRGKVVSSAGDVAGAQIVVDTDPPGSGPNFRAETDAAGEFVITGVPEGDFVLHASRHGYVSSRPYAIRGLGPHDLRIELEKLGLISGRLLGADGKPARNGVVEVWRTVRGQPPYWPTADRIVIEDPEGRFAVEPEGGGSFILLGRADDCAPTWSEVIQTRSDPVALGDWRLPAGATLRGVLVAGSAETPLADALLQLRPSGWTPAGEQNLFIAESADAAVVPPLRARSGADGSFRLEHVPPGVYTLSIEHADASTRALPIESSDGADRDLGRVRLDGASRLVGRAFDVDGAPLAGGNLMLSTSENGLGQINRLLDARGEARMSGLAPGDYWVSAIEGGGLFGRVSKPVKIWLGAGEVMEVEVRLEE
jgi:hypothetical protein